jgi:uncharacterized protein YmfQ (DUF2313 family)
VTTSVRHDAGDYQQGFSDLLPTGPAWPRDDDTALMRLLAGLSEIWGGEVDGRAADLIERESDPRATLTLLPEWERAFGLPDPCLSEPLTIPDRQKALANRMTTEGGQSRAFFIATALALGYQISIREFAPFMAGISRCGDTRATGSALEFYAHEIGAPEMRFYWVIKVGTTRVTWFRCGSGECGVDPHVRIALATDLECVMRRWKPAHTEIVFDYSEVGIDPADIYEDVP